MTNTQLKAAMSTKRQKDPANPILLEEIKNIREEIAEMKRKVELLATCLDDAYTINHGQ